MNIESLAGFINDGGSNRTRTRNTSSNNTCRNGHRYHHLSLYIPEKLNFLSFITSFRGNKPDQSRHAGSAAASKIARIIVPRTEPMNITSLHWDQVRISRPHRPEECQPERRE